MLKLKYIFEALNNKKETPKLLYIFAISFCIRLGFCLAFVETRGIFLDADASEYIRFGKQIIEQGLMVRNIEPLKGSMIGPGYPMLVAFNFLISGTEHYWFLIIVQCLFGSLSVVLIYKMAILITGQKSIALMSAIWLATYFQYIWYTPWILKETIVFLLFPLSVYLLNISKVTLKVFSIENLLFILITTFLIHTDERYLIFIPLYIGYILFPFKDLAKRIFMVVFTVLGFAICLVPWTYRNYMVYNRPVLITVRTTVLTDKVFGYEPLWDPSKRYNPGSGDYRVRPDSEKNNSYYKAIVDSLKSGMNIVSTEDHVFGVNALKSAIIKGKIPHAHSTWERRLSYFKAYWEPFNFSGNFYGYGYRYERAWNTRMNLTSIMQYGILLPFFLFGIYCLFQRKSINGILYSLIIFLHTFLHTFMAWGGRRYRLPIDFFIIIIAFVGIKIIIDKFTNKTTDNIS